MKKILILSICIGYLNSFIPMATAAQKNTKTLVPAVANTQIGGHLGVRIDACIEHRVKAQDVDHLIEPFRNKTETKMWQCEFWGKWVQGAIGAYQYNRDPDLLKMISTSVDELLKTQLPNGYIGNYPEEAQLQHWDIWGRKYSMLGLIAFYDLTADPKALVGARKVADHLINQLAERKIDIVKTGNYHGMANSSVLEPIVKLYTRTKDQRYLDFANLIVSRIESKDGPQLIAKALLNQPVAERFPQPEVWWSYENGQKAYEMMSCYQGLLELYQVTGEPVYLEAVVKTVNNIIESEINVAGSGAAFECWYLGKSQQTTPAYHTMETCVTMTWMKLCSSLLEITKNPVYVDQLEKTIYNALLASMKYDASEISKYSPLEGRRHAGERQCNMNINCCNANGPRAFVLIPQIAHLASGNNVMINLYGESTVKLQLQDGNLIDVKQTSDYPETEKVNITLSPEKNTAFNVLLRIPLWSKATTIKLNGVALSGIIPGSYFKIAKNWTKDDKIEINLDLTARVLLLNGQQAITRGPIVLARDTRFKDGFIDQSGVIVNKNEVVEVVADAVKPEHIWMSFKVPVILGADLEGEYRQPRMVHFCDFSSAGNQWNDDERYKVWIPKTLNVMKSEYNTY